MYVYMHRFIPFPHSPIGQAMLSVLVMLSIFFRKRVMTMPIIVNAKYSCATSYTHMWFYRMWLPYLQDVATHYILR